MELSQLFKEQRERFDDRFVNKFSPLVLCDGIDSDDVKTFLSQCQAEWLSHRTEDHKALLEVIRGMKMTIKKYSNERWRGYNEALSTIESEISKYYGIK